MKKILWVLIFLLQWALPALAVTLGDATITRGVRDRTPLDRIETYQLNSDVATGEISCFTRIDGATQDTKVEHVWFYGAREMARVELPVRSSRWRTYSSKKILPQWRGDWRVQVVAADGSLLGELAFVVE